MSTVVVLFPKPKKGYGKFRCSAELAYDSNPTETDFELSLEAVDAGRKILCRRQTQCVTFAASENWSSFRCDSCTVEEKMSPAEHKADLDGLADLLRMLDLFRCI